MEQRKHFSFYYVHKDGWLSNSLKDFDGEKWIGVVEAETKKDAIAEAERLGLI